MFQMGRSSARLVGRRGGSGCYRSDHRRSQGGYRSRSGPHQRFRIRLTRYYAEAMFLHQSPNICDRLSAVSNRRFGRARSEISVAPRILLRAAGESVDHDLPRGWSFHGWFSCWSGARGWGCGNYLGWRHRDGRRHRRVGCRGGHYVLGWRRRTRFPLPVRNLSDDHVQCQWRPTEIPHRSIDSRSANLRPR